jgi:hypothetical protein
LAQHTPDFVIVSALQPFGLTPARKLYLQVRARLPKAVIVIGLWNFTGEIGGVLARLGPDTSGLIVTSLASALQNINALQQVAGDPDMHPDPVASR